MRSTNKNWLAVLQRGYWLVIQISLLSLSLVIDRKKENDSNSKEKNDLPLFTIVPDRARIALISTRNTTRILRE